MARAKVIVHQNLSDPLRHVVTRHTRRGVEVYPFRTDDIIELAREVRTSPEEFMAISFRRVDLSSDYTPVAVLCDEGFYDLR